MNMADLKAILEYRYAFVFKNDILAFRKIVYVFRKQLSGFRKTGFVFRSIA